MRFSPPLIEARLRRRYKRFLADVELDGEVVVVHCANPGRMSTCAVAGAPVWLLDSQNDRRKLRYTWELARIDGDLICVNTARANQLVGAALDAGEISELAGYDRVSREVACGESRIDFSLEGGPGSDRPRCLVEVKTVTLRSAPRECSFPDSVTVRGRKHLETLMRLAAGGERAVLLFVCGRTPTDSIRPADEIDPEYAETLRRAAGAGVEILCYSTAITLEGIELDRPIPVVL